MTERGRAIARGGQTPGQRLDKSSGRGLDLTQCVDRMGAAPLSDAAELRRAKEAAEAANEAKTRYLVSLSHEIRSPLNAIYGYAQLLERDGGAVTCAEAGAVIRRSAEHLTNLVESLLEISRIESGVISVRSEVTDIRGLLDQVVEMFRVQAAAKGLSLILKVSDRLPSQVKTDEKRVRQILINLVSNAIKYTQSGGATITVDYGSQVADIRVTDSGIGIAAGDLERVFEPFERGGSPEAQLQPGIGLGLAITRVLARVLGGDLTATSQLGSGSTFRLRLSLPAPMTAVEGAPPRSRVKGYDGAPRTVLIIDDDPAQIAVLQSLLRPLGFIAYAADNGLDGVALAARCSPDIVLLDNEIPGLSGWATAERLRGAHGGALKILMVSANAHERQRGRVGRGDPDGFMSKPVNLDALLTEIGGQLGLRWTAVEAPPEAETNASTTPPLEASPFIEQLRHSARIGHVRGVAEGIDGLRKAVPAASELAARLARHLDDLDLRSLIRALDDVGR